ncbi:MAG: ABC transporter substrate-binding protein [Coriobacteriales bacterium]|jgi:NitT/TauT family transport system substrate-binding protein|nr:ABC transporter substrate-binding protein [Coriobacteriales bacterium]
MSENTNDWQLTRRKFVTISAGALLVGASGLLAACTNTASSGGGDSSGGSTTDSGSDTPVDEYPLGKTEIQVLGGGVCGAPAYVALEKGYFKDEGIDVTPVAGSFQQQKDGLASGQFLVTNGDFQFFPAINEGLDLKIIGGIHEGCIKLLVPKDSPITSVAELKGKRIGVDEVGGTPWAITSVALANEGIDPNVEGGDVTWVPYDLSVLAEQADAGEVDAYAAWDPFGTEAERTRGHKVLVDIGEGPIFGGKYCCFLYASGSAVSGQLEQVKALKKAWFKAIEWIAANPREAAEIITSPASANGEPYVASEDIDLIETLLSSYHYASSHSSADFSTAKSNTEYFVGELKKTGYLPEDLDVAAFVEKAVIDIDSL